MVSVEPYVNKPTPTVNSICKILISKLDRPRSCNEEADSDYVLKEGEISIDLEQVHTKLDLEFRKLLLNTKLGDVGAFQSCGVNVEFKLLDITRTTPIYLISDEDKLARAIQHKEAGSELFRQNKLFAAFHRFRASVEYLIFLEDRTLPGADDMYAVVCNNMAMCQMKAGNHEYAIALCNKVLTVDSNNEKALYRRAFCYTELKQYEKAHVDLMMLAQSKDKSVKKLMEVVQQHRKEQHEEYKTVVKNMFR